MVNVPDSKQGTSAESIMLEALKGQLYSYLGAQDSTCNILLLGEELWLFLMNQRLINWYFQTEVAFQNKTKQSWIIQMFYDAVVEVWLAAKGDGRAF